MSATEEINAGAKAHAETNGVIKIGLPRRGLAEFQFGEDDLPFVVDVIQVYDDWIATDEAYRDKDGALVPGKYAEWRQVQHNFVQAIVNHAYEKVKAAAPAKDVRVPNLSRAEAEAFITHVGMKTRELRDFFSPKGEKPSSSSESTEPAQRLNFSQ